MWNKIGDFKNFFTIEDSNSTLNRYVIYVYHSDGLEIKFEILGYSHTTDFKVWFGLKEISKPGDNLLTKIKETWVQTKIIDLVNFSSYDYSSYGFIDSSDSDILFKFVNSIDSVIPFDKKTKQEIFDTLGIKAIIDEDVFFAEIKDLVDASSFEEALKKTLDTESETMLIKLAECCEEKQQWQNTLNCYENIAESSSYYPKANSKIAHLLMQLQLSYEMNEQPLSDIEKKKYKEEEFRHLLQGESNDQCLTDRLFQELSGEGISKDSEINNVNLNADTLLKLAYQAKKFREEIAKLKAENEELKRNLSSSKNTTSLSTRSGLSDFGIFNDSIHKTASNYDFNNNNNVDRSLK